MMENQEKHRLTESQPDTPEEHKDLTSSRGRVIMSVDQTVNLENEISAQSTVQADRELTAPNGCRMRLFFKAEHDPMIRKEVARLLLMAFAKERNA